jgi:Fe2+ or Zn2+ uptake regulation protein
MKEPGNCEHRDIMGDLRRADVRPSTARVHVLKYLREHRNHPTVDRIYRSLLATLPGLSRTSVYNTLGVLTEARLVRPLSMEAGETRYDASTEDHGHFQCERCGAIFDIEMDAPRAVADGLRGFTVNRRDFLLWGLCPECASSAKVQRK